MAEGPPELLEPIETGDLTSMWRVRLADGREAIATQLLINVEADRKNLLDRIRRLARIPSPNLIPPRGWWSDGQGVWFVSDLEQGLALDDLQGGGFLSPQQSAAVSFGILAGLDALHAEGLRHGSLNTQHVRLMPDGRVALTGHQLVAGPPAGQSELAAEVREAGRLVCQAFGITAERDPRAAPRAIEHAAPALVVTARAIAAGNFGADLRTALGALRDTSGALGGSDRLALGAQELAAAVSARRTGGEPVRLRSLATPIAVGPRPVDAVAAVPAPVLAGGSPPTRPSPPGSSTGLPAARPAVPRRTWEERQARPLPHEYSKPRGGSSRGLLIGGLAVIVLIAVAAGVWAAGRSSGPAQTVSSSSPAPVGPTSATKPKPSSASSPTARTTGAAPVPTFAPASVGSIRGVAAKPTSACDPGGACIINVVITFKPAGSPHDVTWKFRTFDPCTSQTVDLGGGVITAQGDWNTTDGNTAVSLPAAKGQLAVVALSGPEEAASPPFTVGAPAC